MYLQKVNALCALNDDVDAVQRYLRITAVRPRPLIEVCENNPLLRDCFCSFIR